MRADGHAVGEIDDVLIEQADESRWRRPCRCSPARWCHAGEKSVAAVAIEIERSSLLTVDVVFELINRELLIADYAFDKIAD